jgi:hypothetical protein
MTPEGRVKQKVKEILDGYPGMFYDMPVPTGFGRPTLDFIGCYGGLYFAVETKALGKKPTPRQLDTIWKMRKAGAAVFVVIGEDDVALLQLWLETHRPQHDSARVSPTPRSRRPI